MINKLSDSKFLIPAMVIIAVLAASSGFYISLKQQRPVAVQTNIDGLFWPNPKQLKPFSVMDQNGQAFGLEQLQGQWSFVFFGYTHCPDICPITMAIMADVYTEIIDQHHNIQTLFVSVDPKRDSAAQRQQYVAYFHDQFIGLGGDTAMLESLTKQIGVAYYVDEQGESDNYIVDHTASIFLFDPAARLVSKFSSPHQKDQIIEQFTQIKTFIMSHSAIH